MKAKNSSAPRRGVVTLADLAPQHRVTGGSERRVFGADPLIPPKERSMTATKKATSDLQTKKSSIKGGGGNTKDKLAVNDNLTLVRAAKPAKKDLPAGKDVKGGKKAAKR
jgi:hypothetical protein